MVCFCVWVCAPPQCIETAHWATLRYCTWVLLRYMQTWISLFSNAMLISLAQDDQLRERGSSEDAVPSVCGGANQRQP